MKKRFIPLGVAGVAMAVVVAQVVTKDSQSISGDFVRAPEVDWGALNPARGKMGPRAGTLWNDRTKEKASGFLVKFKDGFSSPPHIHNVTYRGVVISGLVHNDDPQAEEMWMPAGSFWTQPAGEVHITSAKGEEVVAYIEIDSGPYLVLPQEQAFDKGERPINMAPSNVVWLSSSQTSWTDAAGVDIAFLWGTPSENTRSGSFIRLPKGFEGELINDGAGMRVVVIKGGLTQGGTGGNEVKGLSPGSYFGIPAAKSHKLKSDSEEGCLVYVRAEGAYRVTASPGA